MRPKTPRTTKPWRVMRYDTGVLLNGDPSPELCRRSVEAEPTGVVLAYCDARGMWQYVPESLVGHYSKLGTMVVSVYVER